MKKSVLVTGGAGGIGSAIVRRLNKDGFHVVIGYKSRKKEAIELAKEVDGEAVFLDFSTKESLADAVSTVSSYALDGLVNNAGESLYGLLQDASDEEISRILRCDLEGAISLSKAVLPHMIRVKYGRIVQISSIWGVSGGACETIYSAAKSGLIGFTKALAREVGLSGITVNAVAPGLIDTAMNHRMSAKDLEEMVGQTAVGRIGTPQDVAAATAFFMSDDASFVTGQTLVVDGGLI